VIIDATGSFNNVNTSGAAVSVNHRLTALSSLNAFYTYTRSNGEGTNTVKSTTNFANIAIDTKFTPKTTGSIGLRHVNTSGTTPSRENAIYAAVTHTF